MTYNVHVRFIQQIWPEGRRKKFKKSFYTPPSIFNSYQWLLYKIAKSGS